MTKYVIGTLSRIDAPLTPQLRTVAAMVNYFNNDTEEENQKRRDQILTADAEDIRALAPLVKVVMKDNTVCVMGSERKIKEESRFFKETVFLPK